MERIQALLEHMIEPEELSVPFDLLLPPKRHDIDYVARKGEPVFMRYTHVVLPASFTEIVNSASTEDFEQLMTQTK